MVFIVKPDFHSYLSPVADTISLQTKIFLSKNVKISTFLEFQRKSVASEN